MFSWEGQEVITASAEVALRDPRKYRIGLLTTGPWPPAGPAQPHESGVEQKRHGQSALHWFGRHPELAQFLMRVEPRRWGMEMGELIAFKARIHSLITAMEVTGLNEDLRAAFNEMAAPLFGIRWWGSLETLKQGQGDWPQEVLLRYAGLPRDHAPVTLENREIPGLISFLQRDYAPARAQGTPMGSE